MLQCAPLQLSGSLENELQPNPVGMRVRGSVDPSNLQKRGDPDRQPRKWDLASKDLRQLKWPISEKAHATGAEILNLRPEEFVPFVVQPLQGQRHVGKPRIQRISRM